MNIFVLDLDHTKCAEYHVDRHCVKMILEYAQLLSTAVNMNGGIAPYRTTHKNHPCAIWARESKDNWLWLQKLGSALHTEYKYRYGKEHKSGLVVENLKCPDLPDIGLTPFAQAMPPEYKNSDAVTAYRTYYKYGKQHLMNWKNRPVPDFLRG